MSTVFRCLMPKGAEGGFKFTVLLVFTTCLMFYKAHIPLLRRREDQSWPVL